MTLAPICLFTYNRLEETQQTIAALQKNFLAKESELFIFSDGAKNSSGEIKIQEVRQFLKTIEGFKTIKIIESPQNKGLANSIITGVTAILKEYEHVIVLEDDLITSPNFLYFINQALDFYENNQKIISISGHTLDFNIPKDYKFDNYFFGRAGSWGWATWKNRWDLIDWEIKDWKNFKNNRKSIKKFKINGNDLYSMLEKYIDGLNNSWAIRFCYNQFKYDMYTVYPCVSKVNNIGFSNEATNCKGYNRYKINYNPENNIHFNFIENIQTNNLILKQIRFHLNYFSQIKSKILTIYFKLLRK